MVTEKPIFIVEMYSEETDTGREEEKNYYKLEPGKSVSIAGDILGVAVAVQCEECEKTHVLEFDYPEIEVKERNMGPEKGYHYSSVFECENCKKIFDIEVTHWEYPHFVHHTPQIEGKGFNPVNMKKSTAKNKINL